MRGDRESTVAVVGRLLAQALRGEGVRIAGGLALLTAAAGILVLEPWPLKLIVDSVLGDRPLPGPLARLPGPAEGPDAGGARLALLAWLCAGMVALRLLAGICTMLSTNALVSIGLRMVFRLRCRLFDHVQRLSLAFHDATPVGDSLYRVTWDSYAAQTIFNSGLIPAVTSLVTVGGILVMLGQGDPLTTVAALAVCVPLAVLIRLLDRPMTTDRKSVV